jgi:hypothetical protein
MKVTRGFALLVAALCSGGVAHADVKADQLFQEGRKLLDAGDLQGACAKFDASMRADPRAIGTLLNLALCDEKLGRVASAVKLFSEARDRAQEQGLASQQAAAEEHLATLAPLVPHVTLAFKDPPPPGTKILIDEEVIPLSQIGDLALDPGERALVVTAPDRVPYEAKFLAERGGKQTVTVPALRRATEIRRIESSQRTVGWIVAGSGGAVALGGVAFGLVGRKNYNAQFQPYTDGAGVVHMAPCGKNMQTGKLECDSAGQAKTESARNLGLIGTVVGVVGVAAIAVGGYLWFTAPPSSSEHAVAIVPAIGPDQVGVAALGRF